MARIEQSDVLSRMVRELRTDPVPDVDWERTEKSLMERVERSPMQASSQPRRRPLVRFAIAAAAATVLGAFGARELILEDPVQQLNANPQRWNVEGRFTIEGSSLAVGQRVISGSAEVRVVHAGHAAWTLSPHSRGMVAFGGELFTVQLEQGAVLAEVVPTERRESFAIEADALRAAAHGTVFRVTRQGNGVHVDVTEGVVAVGPASTRGDTRGWLLTAPARGRFSLDGKSGAVGGATSENAAAAGASGSKTAPVRSVETSAAAASAEGSSPAAAELPDKPTMDDVQAGFAKLVPLVNQCFEQHTQARGDMQVTAHTRLTVRVAPDGAITGRDFVPPLAPAVLQCSAPKLDAMRFAASKQGITVTRFVQFGD